MKRSHRRLQGQGGKQGVALWLIVLERMASTLQDNYNLGAPVTIRPTLELFTAFRERIEEDPPVHPRYGLHKLPPFPGGPFAASRVLARTLARQERLGLEDKYQLNSDSSLCNCFPAMSYVEVEQLVDVLTLRLVKLARYLAREVVLPRDDKRFMEDFSKRKPLSTKTRSFVSCLFWEGLVEGIRPHIEDLQEELDILDELRANPARWRYTPEQVLKVQIRIAEYQATPAPPATLAELQAEEEEKPNHAMN